MAEAQMPEIECAFCGAVFSNEDEFYENDECVKRIRKHKEAEKRGRPGSESL